MTKQFTKGDLEMNKQQLQQDIDALRGKLSEMEAKLKEPESKLWKPAIGDKYYFSRGDGSIDLFGWGDDTFDIKVLSMGNIFRTREEAEQARDKRLAFVRVTNKLREIEGDWVADFEGRNMKFFPYYRHDCKKWRSNFTVDSVFTLPELYSTEEAWQWVIANMEDDLKLIYGVTK